MVKEPYFLRVTKQSPTEFWINNPTRKQADLAIANGASGCTNNPSYTQKMLDHPEEAEIARQRLDEAIQETDNEWKAAEVFQRKMVKPVAEKFMPMFEKSGGMKGYVSIQGDPINEDDPEVVFRDAIANRKVSPNICCKIPTTSSGLKAMEHLLEENIPINATEIFGVSQFTHMCETYLSVSKRTGNKPMFYMSHIAGIYDDYLQNYVKQNNIDISPDVVFQGGLAVARKVYDDDDRAQLSLRFHRRRGARPAPLHRDGRRQGLHHDQLGRHCRQADRAGPAGGLPRLQPGAPVCYRRADGESARFQTRLPGRRPGA